ncbi:retrovirus-related pol polyprotein from transposon TNT 1-94 [Tanacetum coccineum]
METIHVDFDELTAMASEQSSSGPALHKLTPETLSPGLVPQPPSPIPFVPPTKNDLDTLFQPLFDEYFNPPPCVDHPVPKVAASKPAVSTVIPTGVEEADLIIEVAHMDNNPYVIFPIPEPSSEEFSSYVVTPNNSYKEALMESCWIEAMQEELNELERLEVWDLVPRPDRVMIITLKWIYNVKLDELGGVLKNKARLVARGYCQEEGIDF